MDHEQSALAKYRADHRSRASRTGYPGQRMENPVILPLTPPKDVIAPVMEVAAWTAGGKTSAFDLATGEPVNLNAGWFEAHFAHNNNNCRSRVICADYKTQQKIISRIDSPRDYSEAGNQGTSHAKMLRAMTLIPFSSSFVNLAAALERRWWLPTEGDPGSIGAWKSAFGIEAKGIEGFREMVDYISPEDGETIPSHIASLHKALMTGERNLYDSARYSGVASAMNRHATAEHIEVVNQAIINMDPRSTHESMLSGETVRLEVTGDRRNGNIVGTLSTPCKLRQGKVVLIVEPGSGKYLGAVRLHRMSLLDGELTGEFTSTPNSGAFGTNKGEPFHGAENGAIYTVVPEPYLGGGRRPKNVSKRWLGAEIDRTVSGRRVPVDVMIAGNVN